MAVYKVIQDIEAEDKLLGPLTLKGFIYAIAAGFLAFVNVKIVLASSQTGYRFVAVFILVLPMLLFAVLASPLGGQQPTEVWLLSHIRFFVKPKIRIWSQLGLSQLVTITAPKIEETPLTKNLNEGQVLSRLETLALTLDSRGWAIKNAYPPDYAPTPPPFTYLNAGPVSSDRLVRRDTSTPAPASDIPASADVLDLNTSPKAQRMDELIQKKVTELVEQRLAKIDSARRQAASTTGRHDAIYSEDRAKALSAKPKRHRSAEEAAQSARNMSLAEGADTISLTAMSELAKYKSGPRITKIAPGEVEITLH